MKTEKYYTKKLQAYCDKHYGEYEDDMAFYTNPATNQWRFDIQELNKRIRLTCDDNGNVTEEEI